MNGYPYSVDGARLEKVDQPRLPIRLDNPNREQAAFYRNSVDMLQLLFPIAHGSTDRIIL